MNQLLAWPGNETSTYHIPGPFDLHSLFAVHHSLAAVSIKFLALMCRESVHCLVSSWQWAGSEEEEVSALASFSCQRWEGEGNWGSWLMVWREWERRKSDGGAKVDTCSTQLLFWRCSLLHTYIQTCSSWRYVVNTCSFSCEIHSSSAVPQNWAQEDPCQNKEARPSVCVHYNIVQSPSHPSSINKLLQGGWWSENQNMISNAPHDQTCELVPRTSARLGHWKFLCQTV